MRRAERFGMPGGLTIMSATPARIAIEGEDPRALAINPNGSHVYATIFESGNASTILGGGLLLAGVGGFPPDVVGSPQGPYGRQNPPPNNGGSFDPPLSFSNPSPIPVGPSGFSSQGRGLASRRLPVSTV